MKTKYVCILLIGLVGYSVAAADNGMPPATSLTNQSTYIHIYYGSFLAHADGSFSATQEGGNPLKPQGEELSGGSVETLGITVGFRSGEPALSFGWALELGYLSYESESGSIDLDTLTFSGLLNIHSSLLKTKGVPDGRIRPYAGVGASLLWGDLDAEIMMDDGSVTYGDEIAVGAGFDLRAGLELMLTRKLGLFAEYRYCWFFVGSSSAEDGWGWTAGDYDALDMDLSLGQAVIGLSLTY